MRDRLDRDQQSVVIARALGVFALILTVESIAGRVLHSTLDLQVGNTTGAAAVLTAAALALAFLVRSERS